MKSGENPQRGESHNTITTARIFVVIYIPELSGFFTNMRTILGLSLDSLEQTLDPDLGRVTLISNGSCSEIEELLLNRQSKLFDQILINKANRGKIDGLIAAARGALEEVVIFSDCDVLFQNGWLEEILRVFAIFPEAASVSPIASPRRYLYETRTTILDSMLKGELKIRRRMPREDFDIMTDGTKDPSVQLRYLKGQATISRGGYDTGISGGHQCVAFRSEMLRNLPDKPCLALLEPHADRDYLDRPPDIHGYWRLSTPRNYAYHMGNIPSSWMYKTKNESVEKSLPKLPLPALRKSLIGRLPYSLRRKLAYLINNFLTKRLTKVNEN